MKSYFSRKLELNIFYNRVSSIKRSFEGGNYRCMVRFFGRGLHSITFGVVKTRPGNSDDAPRFFPGNARTSVHAMQTPGKKAHRASIHRHDDVLIRQTEI